MSEDALLREILDQVRELRADVEALAIRARLTRGKLRKLKAALPPVAAVVGEAAFLADDLFEMPSLRGLLEGRR